MLPTTLTAVLGIEHPIIQGPLGGPWPPSVGLAAAVSEAGALGSLPTALRRPEQVREDAARLRDLTSRPFAINHTMRPFIEEVFQAIIEAAPPVVSFALGRSPELVKRAHDAGARFVQQVHSVEQAQRAAEDGADVIIAQGGEAGGFGGAPGTIVLVPQVVEAVDPVPVVAAGGIGDGRGLAAALTLGAAGVNVGTRFLASAEAEIAPAWKQAILGARSQETTRAPFVTQLVPPPSPGSFDVAPRVLRTPFIERWLGRDDDVARERERLTAELRTAMEHGRSHELLLITGETAGMVTEVLPAAEIVRRMVEDAEVALRAAVAGIR
jgi:nitronate monooxygenase/enoyl-[acyl-carrier protein] reductase II